MHADSKSRYNFPYVYRKVNSDKNRYIPLSRIDDYINTSWEYHICHQIGPSEGNWQILLTESAKEISAFVTPNGILTRFIKNIFQRL